VSVYLLKAHTGGRGIVLYIYIYIIYSAHFCNHGVCNYAHLGIYQYAHIIMVLSASSPSHDNFSMLIHS